MTAYLHFWYMVFRSKDFLLCGYFNAKHWAICWLASLAARGW